MEVEAAQTFTTRLQKGGAWLDDMRVLGRSWHDGIASEASEHERVTEAQLRCIVRAVGLARIYGTCTPLPDGRDSREYLAHLHVLENEAKAAKRGGWGMVQP